MALLKYLKRSSSELQTTSLCDKEVQEEVRKVLLEKGTKKSGEYTRNKRPTLQGMLVRMGYPELSSILKNSI